MPIDINRTIDTFTAAVVQKVSSNNFFPLPSTVIINRHLNEFSIFPLHMKNHCFKTNLSQQFEVTLIISMICENVAKKKHFHIKKEDLSVLSVY